MNPQTLTLVVGRASGIALSGAALMRACLRLTVALALLVLAGGFARAATFSSSATAPTVDSTDVANYAAQTGTDKWFFQSANESNPSDAATVANPTTWTIRLGTLSGTNFTQCASETANTGTGHYITWTLTTPSITWTKSADFTGTFTVETCDTLGGIWTTVTHGINVIITGNNVPYIFPSPPARVSSCV